jgi:hypothetical protein
MIRYYGSAELAEYACYVIADGLEPADRKSQSAALAVHSAIAAFHEHPSIGQGAIGGYVRAAHRALTENSAHLRMTASITVVVTDYPIRICGATRLAVAAGFQEDQIIRRRYFCARDPRSLGTVRYGSIKSSLESAENEPAQALEGLERLLLDRHPSDIDNYTAAVVFIDKVYNDPNKGKKFKRILRTD